MAVTSGMMLETGVVQGETNERNNVFRNRVWDTQVVGSDKSYYWVSTGSPDYNGDYYTGPGTWGVHTSDFCSLKI